METDDGGATKQSNSKNFPHGRLGERNDNTLVRIWIHYRYLEHKN